MSLLIAALLTASLAQPAPPSDCGGPPPPPPEVLDFAYDEDESGHLDAQEQSARDADLADGKAAIESRVRPPRGEHPPRPPGPPPRLEKGELPPPLVDAFDRDGDDQLDATERQAARIEIQESIRTGRPPHPHPPR